MATPRHLHACHGCDLLQRIPRLEPGGKARCGRCNELLAVHPKHALDAPLALSAAAAVLLVIANVCPLMTLSVAGRTATTTLAGGAYEMWMQGSEITAVVVAFCAVIAPIAYVAATLAVMIAIQRPPAPAWAGDLMRVADRLRPWSMNEVLLLGILVALTKIAELAEVIPGEGLFAIVGLVVLLPWIASTFDPGAVWERILWDSPR
ncbi:MAG: paraquat-inducible protein A [Burkholderiales bacterium]